MHTHMEGAVFGNAVQQLPTSTELNSDVRCFLIYQLCYTLDLSETRLPLLHNRLLLTIPYKNIEISSHYFPYASGFISAQLLQPKQSKRIAHHQALVQYLQLFFLQR